MLFMQVAILLGRLEPSIHVPAHQALLSVQPQADADLSRMSDLHEGFASVQRRLDSVVQALAAHGINI